MVTVPLILALIGGTQVQAAGPDSVALVSQFCFSYCESHRVVVARTGRVRFEWSVHRRVAGRDSSTIDAEAWKSIVWHTAVSRILSLPDRIHEDRTLCPDRATDHGDATVTVYIGIVTKQVEDDHGCFTSGHSASERLLPLRALEAAMDSLSGVHRWLPRRNSTWDALSDTRGVIRAVGAHAPQDTAQWFVSSGEDSAATQLAGITGHPVSPIPLTWVDCPSAAAPIGRRIGIFVMTRWAWKTADSVHVFVVSTCRDPANRDREGEGSGTREYIVTRSGGSWVAKPREMVSH